MRAFFALMTMLFLIGQSNASTNLIGIEKIDTVEGDETSVAIYATNGLIYEIDSSDKETIEQAILAKENKQLISIEVTNFSESEDILGLRNQILDIERLSRRTDEFRARQNTNKFFYDPKQLNNDYVTNFRDQRRVDEIFRSQRTDVKEKSQCYNRAHVWSWEMRRYSENGRVVQPGKMWMYFTKKYIRAYRFKWWFHIAPYVQLNGEEVVMDKKFLRGPISTRGWTDFFIQPRTECQNISRYSQYENNPNDGHCFLMRTSVHYYQPYQAENLEKGTGQEQTSWQQWELKQAYKDGVGSRRVPNL